jgi:hydrogenase expression/formation protein HypC
MCLAVPGKILSIDGDDALLRSAKASFGGAVMVVSLACAPEARVGDYVLVHAGLAISVIDEAAAAKTLSLLQELRSDSGPGGDLL